MKKIIFIGCVVLSMAACSPTATFTSQRWTGQGPAPAEPSGLNVRQAPLVVGAKHLMFQTQTIEDVQIEGSYYKKISQQGDAEFIDYRWMSKIPLSVRRDLLLMRAQRHFVLSHFLDSHDIYTRVKLLEGPVLSLRMETTPEVLWKLIFEQQDGSLQCFYINKDLQVVGQRRIGSEFIDATASLFPQGPLKSDLQEVLLHGLVSHQNLSSSLVQISTEADQIAVPGDNGELNFKIDDLRFSQVQAFFYMSQALTWMQKNLSFQLPFVLEAETQIGFPEKTNAAFYFQHKIRLGEGDGDVFDHIPMDPSIVTHESMHAVIEAVARLPYDNEGGSLNEAYADFFATVQLNNPKLGEASYKKAPFKRTVDNDMKLSEKNGGLYHDSGIVSGLLWSLHKDLDPDVALNIAWQTLLRLNPTSDFNGFKQELLSVLEKETPDTQKKVQTELKSRGWLD